jgi:hypothetical protein
MQKNKGDDHKVKAEYLATKFRELKKEKIERARRAVEEGILDAKDSVMQATKTGAYELKKVRSSEYWLLSNGRVVVPSPKGNYGIYNTEPLAADSIDYFESYGQYKSKGLEFIISADELSAYQVYFGEKQQRRDRRKSANPNLVERVSKRKDI